MNNHVPPQVVGHGYNPFSLLSRLTVNETLTVRTHDENPYQVDVYQVPLGVSLYCLPCDDYL